MHLPSAIRRTHEPEQQPHHRSNPVQVGCDQREPLGAINPVVGVAQARAQRLQHRVSPREINVRGAHEDGDVRGRRKVPAEARVQVAHIVARRVVPGELVVVRERDRPAGYQSDNGQLVRRLEVQLGRDDAGVDRRRQQLDEGRKLQRRCDLEDSLHRRRRRRERRSLSSLRRLRCDPVLVIMDQLHAGRQRRRRSCAYRASELPRSCHR
mmetsp:Transcript_59815/g.177669  ORF Transcript_59815/g.177669 Transcript_59815/m.177669 type:complete len:210 (+) Transcript_59815:615-1244(+)